MKHKNGFTLIELSIVLVIIGLIIGGILVGQDLINAAVVRSQVTQIEKYNTAVNTFRGKYNNHLPGDIPNPDAPNFGFMTRGALVGQGDGNDILEGTDCCTGRGAYEGAGETLVFWEDLSTAQLIDGSFNSALMTGLLSYDITPTSTPKTLSAFLPAAKIGSQNYVYVYSNVDNATPSWSNISNYFGVSSVSKIADSSFYGDMFAAPGLTVQQAYNIDKKMDDGVPQSGAVLAMYLDDTITQPNNSLQPAWAAGGGNNGAN